MKKIVSVAVVILITAFCFGTANAQNVVALHSGNNVSLFYSADGFQKAYDAAIDGDVIYLPGTTFSPPPVIKKQISIYGTGHYNTADSPTGKTVINGNLVLTTGADHVHLEGLYVQGSLSVGADISVNHLLITRCYFSSGISFAGSSGTNFSTQITIKESVIQGTVTLRNARTLGVYNSILGGYIYYSENNVFSNNILFYASSPVYYSNNNHFTANIFRVSHNSSLVSNATGNYFSYNVIEADNPTYGTGAQVTGNYTGVGFSSVFVNQSGTSFDYSHDYHLVSPTTYVDGQVEPQQVGIYGGMFPYKENAVPVIPQVVSKSIDNKTNQDGMLEVDIEVNAQQD